MFTVADLLELPAVKAARPEVAYGEALAVRPVRWAHTSEIYDISPLLKGGEVLLTTGLGLVAASPEARRSYVSALAGVGVAALVLELGRSFPAAPPEIVAEAQRTGLPLVLLHGVVPFIEITEAVHTRLLGADIERLRSESAVRDRLIELLTTNRGVVAFTGAIAEHFGHPVGLRDARGELVASTAAVPGDGGHETDGSFVDVPVLVAGEVWGRLEAPLPGAARPGEDDADQMRSRAEGIRSVLEAAAPLVALELARPGAELVSRQRAAAELVRDLLTGGYASATELTSRARGVGVQVRPGQQVLAVCVRPRRATRSTARLLVAARQAAPATLGPALVGEYDGDVLVGSLVPRRRHRPAVAAFAEALRRELGSSGGGVLVSASAPVDAISELITAFPSAVQTARLAQRLAPAAGIVHAPDFGLYQLIASLVDDEALESFVNEQLGPLLEHDARTGAGLVMTLDAYLASGLSKTRTAEVLGLRRQTLYGRFERISALLGGLDLDDRERRTALDLALVTWRLRVSGLLRGESPRPWRSSSG